MNEDYFKVRNRETLRKLDCGVEITRATRHEPIDFASLSQRRLQDRTDPSHAGSKFLSSWPVSRVVEWIADQVNTQQWRFPPGAQQRVRVRFLKPVGYVKGRLVHTITLTISGRWVHAYPDEDRP